MNNTLPTFIRSLKELPILTNDSIVSMVLPLFQSVVTIHQNGKVIGAPIYNYVVVDEDTFDLDNYSGVEPILNKSEIEKLFTTDVKSFTVSGQLRTITEINESGQSTHEIAVLDSNTTEIKFPVYLTLYQCYETRLGHHDALTDLFCLGMVLAGVALQLDFNQKEELEEFVRHREQMLYLHPRLHPAIAFLIYQMTDLDRKKRIKDMQEVCFKLHNYKAYNPEQEIDLSNFAAQKKSKNETQLDFVLSRLRTRLFDVSRRNKLLYFKSSTRFLNLTVASVPHVLNYRQIKPDSLFIWNKHLATVVKKQETLSLTQFLQCDDYPYIQSQLDQLRLEANRDIQEYGFSSLRLGIVFIHWYNFKEDPTEKISTPLLLLPVKLSKKKGLKDQYLLEFVQTEAEVNPVLAYQLRDLYNIKLPDFIDLREQDVTDFFIQFQRQIEATNAGIQLSLVEKPRIQLIHSQAKQTLSRFNQKLKHKRNLSSYQQVDYSYSAEQYLPLGLQLFHQFVKLEPSHMQLLVNNDLKPNSYSFAAANTNRELYSISEGDNNHFNWEMDLCHVVLGNFNYKKMSLVRDYNAVIEDKISNTVVQQLFSNQPKAVTGKDSSKLLLENHFHVVPSDPTQTQAIECAGEGQSYIIQGPPGTGKSQTITNLVAYFIAKGKKVLFVCEKRAAIDVVYYRLQQQGLNELCCLIHDTQTDKKEFILDLKKCYTKIMAESDHLEAISNHRKELLRQIDTEIKALQSFHGYMSSTLEDAATDVRSLYQVLNKHKTAGDTDSFVEQSPSYKYWVHYGQVLHSIEEALSRLGKSKTIANHAFSKIKVDLFSSIQSMETLERTNKEIETVLLELEELFENEDVPETFTQNLEAQNDFFNQLRKTYGLAETDNIDLINASSEKAQIFDKAIIEIKKIEKELLKWQKENNSWTTKLSERDTTAALPQMQQFESSFFRFFQPAYWRLKRTLDEAYNFSRHAVKPSYSQMLQELTQEYALKNSVDQRKEDVEQLFHIQQLETIMEEVLQLRKLSGEPVFKYVLANENPNQLVQRFAKAEIEFRKAQSNVYLLFYNPGAWSIDQSIKTVQDIKEQLLTIRDLYPFLKELSTMPVQVAAQLLTLPLQTKQLEKVMAAKSLTDFYASHNHYLNFGGTQIRFYVEKIKTLYQQYFEVNAKYILALQHHLFKNKVQWSERSLAGMNTAEKEHRKQILEARKILENEFSKSMRFKSIRELAAAESGELIRELKPVWLMSPTSVSDALPLSDSFFDVVVYDEASQITLEEGIPALFRAKQSIIVGDEMQMPPTNFFGSVSSEKEDIWNDDVDEKEVISLDADSLLTQGARKLPSIMLGWHYRSRSESLISFSNAAFYERSLLTIPDIAVTSSVRKEIKVNTIGHANEFYPSLFDRPISYHHLENGVYTNRTNESEAEYIAQLIKIHLCKQGSESIGVVAFSQEQQGEIEDALAKLAIEDSAFDALLEEEYKRMDMGQYVGLFIKNLENVQGDERDIIIISTCYGYDSNHKMLMNFGPINRRGGEKRLNVIFSRAKKHMAVVSSIKYFDIKNEYNDGANYFRRYLQYAELVSLGQMNAALGILDSLCPAPKKAANTSTDFLLDDIANVLQQKGYSIQKWIGQSYFQCHLGVKLKPEDNAYRLGIMLDDETHYSNNNILEQYFLRQQLMQNFGWTIYPLFAKDWIRNEAKIIQEIEQLLKGERLTLETNFAFPDFKPIASVIAEKEQEKEEQKGKDENAGQIDFVHLEAETESGKKYWEAYVTSHQLVITYGRINSKGQKMVKDFASNVEAIQELHKLKSQKLKRGYA